MSGLKQIRSRISSVKNTQQITEAMKMTAVSRLKKAQARILNLRPYAENILSVMADTALSCNIRHPLLKKPDKMRKILLVILTSDRGLCGGFNNNICRFAEKLYHSSEEEMDFFFIGRKAKNYFKFRNIVPVEEMFNLDREISYPLAGKIAQKLMQNFSQGRYEGIYFIYNSFKSVISQKTVKEIFLPVDLSKASLSGQSRFSQDLIFETPPEELLKSLIKKHFTVQVYRAMCESVAGEYGARMTAMENAAKNAGEIISKLTLTFNKMRQSAITTELIEVSSGAEALKSG